MSEELSLKDLFSLESVNLTKWVTLAYIEHDIDIIMHAQREILKRSEDYVFKMKEQYDLKISSDSNINKNPKSIQEEMDNESYKDHFYGEEGYVISEVLQSHRKAFVISMVTIIENRLKEICEYVESEFGMKKSNKVKGEIYRIYRFLIDEIKIDESLVKELYNKIDERRYIRNRIVHHDSMIKDKPPVSGLKFNEYPSGSKITILDVKYLDDFLNDTHDFFKTIIKAIDIRYQEEKLKAC